MTTDPVTIDPATAAVAVDAAAAAATAAAAAATAAAAVATATGDVATPAAPPTVLGDLTADQIASWEDLLAYVADPRRPRPTARAGTPALLSHLLARAGIDEAEFWSYGRNRRSRVLRAGYARQCRDVPGLELSAFDLEKLLKERFRHEPLTLGAAWHHGFFRSYFSHAAITHPANDGLREEFSTVWDIVRKRPAVVFRGGTGESRAERLAELAAVRLDLPMIVGPLPFSVGVGLELAYLRAVAGADAGHDLRTRTLVAVEADRALRHAAELLPHATALLPRLAPRHAALLANDCPDRDALVALLRGARVVELDPWSDQTSADRDAAGGLVDLAAAVRACNPELLLSVHLRYGGPADGSFWEHLLEAARCEGVALVHYQAGPAKSYRLTPRIDAFLKDRLLRARVQLVSAGGDSDTQASAATVYESVLLGANGGAMTYAAVIPLAPDLVDALTLAGARRTEAAGAGARRTDAEVTGARRTDGEVTGVGRTGADVTGARDAQPPLPEHIGRAIVEAALAATSATELTDLATCTLSCWQHSILDFLSCMGIDDIQKTSGNAMAITMTADWVREVDALATPEFGAVNAVQNRARVAAEPVPCDIAGRYRVSALLAEVEPGLPLPPAARVLAEGGASYHVENSSRSVNADFLEVIYRMAAGELPGLDDFFVAGDHDQYSLDRVGLRLSRDAVAWSLERLRRDPRCSTTSRWPCRVALYGPAP